MFFLISTAGIVEFNQLPHLSVRSAGAATDKSKLKDNIPNSLATFHILTSSA